YRDGPALFQSEFEVDARGRELFRASHQLQYVIGAGVNGQTYIVNRGGYLFQAPLSYYAKAEEWNLSPGYELNDPGFSRLMLPGCVICHSGRPQARSNGNGSYGDPPFAELAIGCENCHGPGQLHVAERSRGIPRQGPTDSSIVNPGKLPVRLAEEICI